MGLVTGCCHNLLEQHVSWRGAIWPYIVFCISHSRRGARPQHFVNAFSPVFVQWERPAPLTGPVAVPLWLYWPPSKTSKGPASMSTAWRACCHLCFTALSMKSKSVLISEQLEQ